MPGHVPRRRGPFPPRWFGAVRIRSYLSAELGLPETTDQALALEPVKQVVLPNLWPASDLYPGEPTYPNAGRPPKETDLAQPLTRRKQATLGLVTTTATAQPLSVQKRRALGFVTETDTPQVVTPRKAKLVSIGLATATSTAQPLGRLKQRQLGQASETDRTQLLKRVLGRPTESDTALSMTPTQLHVKTVYLGVQYPAPDRYPGMPTYPGGGVPTEKDQALSIHRGRRVVLGQPSETDAVFAIAAKQRVAPAQVVEIDLAQPIAPYNIGQLEEMDASQPVTFPRIGQAREEDSAFAITLRGRPACIRGHDRAVLSIIGHDHAVLDVAGVRAPVVTIQGHDEAILGIRGRDRELVGVAASDRC